MPPAVFLLPHAVFTAPRPSAFLLREVSVNCLEGVSIILFGAHAREVAAKKIFCGFAVHLGSFLQVLQVVFVVVEVVIAECEVWQGGFLRFLAKDTNCTLG